MPCCVQIHPCGSHAPPTYLPTFTNQPTTHHQPAASKQQHIGRIGFGTWEYISIFKVSNIRNKYLTQFSIAAHRDHHLYNGRAHGELYKPRDRQTILAPPRPFDTTIHLIKCPFSCLDEKAKLQYMQ